jgi:hypothetical protein
VRIADGPPQRIRDKGQQHLPGDGAWLIGEHRASGEKKYYLANLRTLAATLKARWICEQAHQQLKEELGLDHFEGRSWQGLHRHALMTMIAYAFPSTSSPHNSEAGKKESMGHHLSQACQPFATLSSISSCDRFKDARTAEDWSPQDCSVDQICQSSASTPSSSGTSTSPDSLMIDNSQTDSTSPSTEKPTR